MVTVFKTPDDDAIEISERVKQYVREREGEFGDSIDLTATRDLSRFISQRLDLMVRNARLGLILVALVLAMDRGEAAYVEMMDWLAAPPVIAAHVIVLFIVLFHTITWLNLTPKAMPLWIGDRKVPGWAIVGVHYGSWIVVSAAVLFLAGGPL